MAVLTNTYPTLTQRDETMSHAPSVVIAEIVDSRSAISSDVCDARIREMPWRLAVWSISLMIIFMSLRLDLRASTSNAEMQIFAPGGSQTLPTLCLWRKLTNTPCPGCGLTRAFVAIGHGDWAQAWYFNRTSFLWYGFIFSQIVWQGWQMRRLLSGRFAWRVDWWPWVPFGLMGITVVSWLAKLSGV